MIPEHVTSAKYCRLSDPNMEAMAKFSIIISITLAALFTRVGLPVEFLKLEAVISFKRTKSD